MCGEAQDRTREIEERVAFLDRDLEHLREQVQALWRALGLLEKRLDRLGRVVDVTRGGEDGEAP